MYTLKRAFKEVLYAEKNESNQDRKLAESQKPL
jgi:hypothetical protein